jgi:hypothetical protein
MSDASTDGGEIRQLSLDERIRRAKSHYLRHLKEYLRLVAKSKDKRRLESGKKAVLRAGNDWDKWQGIDFAKNLSLEAILKNDRIVWARLLGKLDSKSYFDEFLSLSPFEDENVTLVECNGHSIKVVQGSLKDSLELSLPPERKALSRYLVIGPRVNPHGVGVIAAES